MAIWHRSYGALHATCLCAGLITGHIAGGVNPVIITDPSAKTIPQRFYRLVMERQQEGKLSVER